MKYLLDTNVWLLMLEKTGQISPEIDRIIHIPGNYPFGLSAISVWEVAKKVSLGKLSLSIPIRDWLTQATRRPFIEIIPLDVEIALESTVLPGTFHKDPADQIIVASARVNNFTLLTTDKQIIKYPNVKTV